MKKLVYFILLALGTSLTAGDFWKNEWITQSFANRAAFVTFLHDDQQTSVRDYIIKRSQEHEDTIVKNIVTEQSSADETKATKNLSLWANKFEHYTQPQKFSSCEVIASEKIPSAHLKIIQKLLQQMGYKGKIGIIVDEKVPLARSCNTFVMLHDGKEVMCDNGIILNPCLTYRYDAVLHEIAHIIFQDFQKQKFLREHEIVPSQEFIYWREYRADSFEASYNPRAAALTAKKYNELMQKEASGIQFSPECHPSNEDRKRNAQEIYKLLEAEEIYHKHKAVEEGQHWWNNVAFKSMDIMS